MGKTLSLDLRERVLAFIVEGHSCHEAARRFRISAASAVRIRQRRRQTGSIAPAKRGRPKGSSRLEVSRQQCGVSQDNSGSQARHYDAGTGRGAYSGTRYAGRSGRAVALPQAPASADPSVFCRRLAVNPIQNQGNRQHPSRRFPIPAPRRFLAKLACGLVFARNPYCHQSLPCLDATESDHIPLSQIWGPLVTHIKKGIYILECAAVNPHMETKGD